MLVATGTAMMALAMPEPVTAVPHLTLAARTESEHGDGRLCSSYGMGAEHIVTTYMVDGCHHS